MAEKFQANSPETPRGQEWLCEAIKSLRPMIIVALALLGGEAAAGTFPKENPYQFRDPSLDNTLVEPRPKYPPVKETVDVLDEKQIEIMQECQDFVGRHYTNPTFRRYLEGDEDEDIPNKNYLLDQLKIIVQKIPQLHFDKRGNILTVTKQEGSQDDDILDDFKVVFFGGRLIQINDEIFDKNDFDDWHSVALLLQKTIAEMNRTGWDTYFDVPGNHRETEAYSYYNIDKFFRDYLEVRGNFLSEEEGDFVQNDPQFQDFVERSQGHSDEGDTNLNMRPFFEDGKIIISVDTPATEGGNTLFALHPNGRILISEDNGITYEPLGEENVFSHIYREQLKSGEPMSALESPVTVAPPAEAEDDEGVEDEDMLDLSDEEVEEADAQED